MFCENCGSPLHDNAKFCQNCGTAVNIIVKEEPAPAVETPVYKQTPEADTLVFGAAPEYEPKAEPVAPTFTAPEPEAPKTQQANAGMNPGYNEFLQDDEHKEFSIASLVLGLLSLGFCWLIFLAVPISIVGIVLGNKGKKRGGRTMALAGIILSIIGLVLSVIIIIIIDIIIMNLDPMLF